jgi:hypothetical protein
MKIYRRPYQVEGMQRLKKLGCRRVLATAYTPPADALYRSALGTKALTETWSKEFYLPQRKEIVCYQTLEN